jgi:hypothetical protein
MNKEIYVFMDSVSGQFGEPFTMANHIDLKRYFEELCKNSSLPTYALRDTVVIHVGTFVIENGSPSIVPVPFPTTVLRGDSFNVEEIRKQVFDVPASAPCLCAEEDCEACAE